MKMRKKLGLVGCGTLGKAAIRETIRTMGDDYELAAVHDINNESMKQLTDECGGKICVDFQELLEEKPDIVIEAAGGAVLKKILIPSLEAGADMIVLSIGAFADQAFYENASQTAKNLGRKIHLASGAIGGFDLMQAAGLYGELNSRIINRKNPSSLPEHYELGEEVSREIFRGSAKEAIALFPKNVNVAVAAALATTGIEQTEVVVISDKNCELNTHRIELSGDFGYAVIEVASKPSPENPASSLIAAYSVVAKLKQLIQQQKETF